MTGRRYFLRQPLDQTRFLRNTVTLQIKQLTIDKLRYANHAGRPVLPTVLAQISPKEGFRRSISGAGEFTAIFAR